MPHAVRRAVMKLPSPSPPSLLLFLLAASVTTSQALEVVRCGDAPPSISPSPSPSPSPSVNSSITPFRANLLELLAALPPAVAPTGFASLSRGAGRDRVFVRGLCRGDMASHTCLADMEEGVRTLGRRCPANHRAAFWDDVFITYADTNASTHREEAFRFVLYDPRNVTYPAAYNQAYGALMGRLVERAAGSGVEAGRPFFATGTGQAPYASDAVNSSMYGLVQCMPDRTAADCAQCLQQSVPELPLSSWGAEGGVVIAYNCYLRIQIYTYYDLALDAPPPPQPLPPAGEASGNGRSRRNVILAVVPTLGTILVLAVGLTVVVYLRRRRSRKRRGTTKDEDSTHYVDPNKFTLPLLRAATGNFAPENKLGEGGFGQVFKGRLEDGQAIAVKRLSKGSLQGLQELKNELILTAKLKHRNLMQLLGVCLEENEKLIVYEYMANSSLDTHLFDGGRRRRQALDWSKRHAIICGIARGLLYLHEESRLRIIHRDLKPSNVLLDADMCPKISDFGLARAFWADESRKVTGRPAGTLGYMSPEYAYYGHVSTKSDMFSFGVIVLEVLTGRRNTSPSAEEDGSGGGGQNLLSYVWEQWQRGSVADVVDASLGEQYGRIEALACAQVGLLCVQEDPRSRPGASEVVLMLDGQSTILQRPSRLAFCAGSSGVPSSGANGVGRRPRGSADDTVSENGVTISEFEPR